MQISKIALLFSNKCIKYIDVKKNYPMVQTIHTPEFPFCFFTLREGVNHYYISKKVKSSMAKSLPVENLLPQNVGSIINYLQ